jgi:hypothetical protein
MTGFGWKGSGVIFRASAEQILEYMGKSGAPPLPPELMAEIRAGLPHLPWTGRIVSNRKRSPISKTALLRFSGTVRRSPAIVTWLQAQPADLGTIARHWFEVMRRSGGDVREVLHDGHPTACVDDAGFAYVNAFKAHVNVGFFRGAELADPAGLLEGTGKFMRHVKLKPGIAVKAGALTRLIATAYADMKQRVEAEKSAARWGALPWEKMSRPRKRYGRPR